MGRSIWHWLSRFAAISQYLGDTSIPTKCLPSRFATNAVVPDPMNGSRTIPPGGLPARIHISANDSGKTAKCASGNFDSGMLHTVLRLRPKGWNA